MKSSIKNRFIFGLLVSCLVLNLTACGGSSSSREVYSLDVNSDAVYQTSAVAGNGVSYFSSKSSLTDTSSETIYEKSLNAKTEIVNEEVEIDKDNDNVSAQAKLIRTVYLNFEAEENIVLDTVEDFVDKAESLGGYAQSNNVTQNGRFVNGELVLRIPSDYVDEFLNYTSNKDLTLVRKSDNQEDVTLQWSEIETRITVLEAQRDKYLGYIENAQTVEEILAIDEKLQVVLTDLELYASQMRVLSNKVNYSTLTINIEYEGEYAPTVEAEDTFFEKLLEGISDAVDEMLEMVIDAISLLILLIVPLITLIIIGFVLIQVFRLFRAYWKRKVAKDKNKNFDKKLDVFNDDFKKKFKTKDTNVDTENVEDNKDSNNK